MQRGPGSPDRLDADQRHAVNLLYFALLCSVLVFVHELGHFVFAKIFGVKVLTFSIGFGPRIVRLRGRETEYCISLLPLGGFVKMLEENRQEPVLPEDKKRTFESASLYKRVIIVLAGPAMNVLFPVLLYFGDFVGETRFSPPTVGVVTPGHPAEGKLKPGDRVLEVDGERISTFLELSRIVARSPNKELKLKVFRDNEHVDVAVIPEEKVLKKPLEIVDRVGEIGIEPARPAAVVGVSRTDSPAYRAGLRTFDVVTEVRGKSVRTYAELETALNENRGETVPVTYLRPEPVSDQLGALADFAVYGSGVAALTPEGAGDLLARTGIESADLYVADVPVGSPEWKADLRPGDRIVEVDHVEVPAWSAFLEPLYAAPDRPHVIGWVRGGHKKSGTIELRREDWMDEYGQHRPRFRHRVSNWALRIPEAPVERPARIGLAFSRAVEETYEVARFIVVGVVRIFEGKVSISSLGGPITVYDVVGQEGRKGAGYFVWVMAVISINLGLINLLPIPVLDGGHLLFFGFEALLRKPLPLRVREVASLAGLIVLIALMGIAFKNDVERRWDVIRGQVKELVG
ncbi:MAG: RIP metalloprotease RseP [Polyangiaceae bacterium]